MKAFTNIAAACAGDHNGKNIRISGKDLVLSDVCQVGETMILSVGARTLTLAKSDVVRVWSEQTKVAYCDYVTRCTKENFAPSTGSHDVLAADLAGHIDSYAFTDGSWAGPHCILAVKIDGDKVELTVSEDEYLVDLYYRLDVEQTIATRAI